VQEPRVVVLTGDAELNEGSNWESILLAPQLGLDNLTLVVVDNHSSSLVLTPLDGKLSAFGWDARTVAGRDHAALRDALGRRPWGAPSAVVADVPEDP
jgi:transketolase